MSIYDVKFYGVSFRYRFDFTGVNIFIRREDVHCVPAFDNSFFEITVLKEYQGQQDVLELVFQDGERTYKTLKYPFLVWDTKENVWKRSKDKATPEAFMKAYFESATKK